MTLIYEKYPKKLPSNRQITYRFCIEHHVAGDLISALAEVTVMELTHQSLDKEVPRSSARFQIRRDGILSKSTTLPGGDF
jgi:hypothetical protein